MKSGRGGGGSKSESASGSASKWQAEEEEPEEPKTPRAGAERTKSMPGVQLPFPSMTSHNRCHHLLSASSVRMHARR